MKITYGDTSFLFTGDASAQEIVSANPGHVDVLKAAHHGSETGTNAAVMAATTPSSVIMSYALGNSYGHPDQSVIDAITSTGAHAFSTAASGTVTATSDGATVTISTERADQIVAGVSAQERAAQEAAQAQAQAQAAQAQAQAQAAQAQSTPAEDIVFITRTGSKYHRSGCRTLGRSKSLTELTRSEAESMGYEACKVCNP